MRKIITTTHQQERQARRGMFSDELSLYWRSGNFSDWDTYANISEAGVREYVERYRASGPHDMLCVDREAMFGGPKGAAFQPDSAEADLVTAALVSAVKAAIPRKPVHVYSGRWLGQAPGMGTREYINPTTQQRFARLARAMSEKQWIDLAGSVEVSLPLAAHEHERDHLDAFLAQCELAKFVCPKAQRYCWLMGTRKIGGVYERIPPAKCDEILKFCAPHVHGFVLFAPFKESLEEPMYAAIQKL